MNAAEAASKVAREILGDSWNESDGARLTGLYVADPIAYCKVRNVLDEEVQAALDAYHGLVFPPPSPKTQAVREAIRRYLL